MCANVYCIAAATHDKECLKIRMLHKTITYALIICLHHPPGAGQTRGDLTFWKFLCQIFYPGA